MAIGFQNGIIETFGLDVEPIKDNEESSDDDDDEAEEDKYVSDDDEPDMLDKSMKSHIIIK